MRSPWPAGSTRAARRRRRRGWCITRRSHASRNQMTKRPRRAASTRAMSAMPRRACARRLPPVATMRAPPRRSVHERPTTYGDAQSRRDARRVQPTYAGAPQPDAGWRKARPTRTTRAPLAPLAGSLTRGPREAEPEASQLVRTLYRKGTSPARRSRHVPSGGSASSWTRSRRAGMVELNSPLPQNHHHRLRLNQSIELSPPCSSGTAVALPESGGAGGGGG
eukprot:479511-Prymnesium_polylepis.1